MKHVMVDIECLGVKPGSVILSIGACRFDETGIAFEKFYRPIDVFDSLMAGLVTDATTVAFWQSQGPEAHGALQPGRPVRETLDAFAAYLKDASLVWAKGPDFDLVLLDAAYQRLGLKRPWKYNASRDVRTILSLAPGAVETTKRAGIAHHALADAVYQAECVRTAASQLGFPLSEMV